jgi:hypothetical protein
MPEIVSIADGDELAFREKAMWLLIRKLGGEVVISDEEWSHVPEAPELILARTDGAMRWVATRRYVIPVLEPASPVAAALDGPEMPGQQPLPLETSPDWAGPVHWQHDEKEGTEQ